MEYEGCHVEPAPSPLHSVWTSSRSGRPAAVARFARSSAGRNEEGSATILSAKSYASLPYRSKPKLPGPLLGARGSLGPFSVTFLRCFPRPTCRGANTCPNWMIFERSIRRLLRSLTLRQKQFFPTVGAVHVTGPRLRSQPPSRLNMVAGGLEVPVVGTLLLLAVNRNLVRIHLEQGPVRRTQRFCFADQFPVEPRQGDTIYIPRPTGRMQIRLYREQLGV